MGSKQFCMAIKGQSKDSVCEILNLTDTELMADEPDEQMMGLYFDNGWYIVCANTMEDLNVKQISQKLLKSAQLITAYFDEDTMQCESTFWENGNCLWSLDHDYDRDD